MENLRLPVISYDEARGIDAQQTRNTSNSVTAHTLPTSVLALTRAAVRILRSFVDFFLHLEIICPACRFISIFDSFKNDNIILYLF